ncbi:MAG: hypothetical protein ACI9Z9_002568 [Litorivivens sp.]
MIYKVAIRQRILILISAFLLPGLEVRAELVSQNINGSIVALNVYGITGKSTATGVVVQTDPERAYLVASTALIEGSGRLTVTMPTSGVELVAQIIKADALLDLALLKVNGLNLRPLKFSRAASDAQAYAEQTRVNPEKQAASIMAETEAMVQFLQKDRNAAYVRLNAVLEQQRSAFVSREDYLIAVFVLVLTLLIMAVLVIQRGGFRLAVMRKVLPAGKPDKSRPSNTLMCIPTLQECVLDGRDGDGIRYLLRICGEQLSDGEGIVVGRNPTETPYIINHTDVSRQHARLKVMKNMVFIEDLGSTNGTSVNGQNIDEKGLFSVTHGDQIIIGSVVMKLRVMAH